MSARCQSKSIYFYFYPQFIFIFSSFLVRIVEKEEEKILELSYHQNKTRKCILNVLTIFICSKRDDNAAQQRIRLKEMNNEFADDDLLLLLLQSQDVIEVEAIFYFLVSETETEITNYIAKNSSNFYEV